MLQRNKSMANSPIIRSDANWRTDVFAAILRHHYLRRSKPTRRNENSMLRESPKLGFLLSLVVNLLVSSIVVSGPIVSMPGPVDIEGTQSRRQLWLVPSTDPSVLMRTTVFRPPGEGPFPLVVMNHGTTQNPVHRQYFPIMEFEAAALWFVEQGFVVVAPQRPGHGETGGIFLEDQANCAPSDFLAAGRAGAANIQSAIDYMMTQSFVLKDGVIVVGQSAGGWDTLALASQNPPMVRLGIDFEGGRGGHFGGTPNNNCHPENLVAAARELGSTAQIPVLMIYTQNDTFFGPALSKQLYEAWTQAGGMAEYHLLAPFKEDGHFLLGYPDSVPVWSPIVAKFLASGPHPWRGLATK
jgi:dienelactone hydrolase